MMGLSSKSPRYATRELVYLGIMADGTDQQVLSGHDYVGVISKAQDYELFSQGTNVEDVPPSAADLDAQGADVIRDAQDAPAGN